MGKLFRFLFILFLLAVVAVGVFFAYNTYKFSSKQIVVQAVEETKISYDAVERLAEAIKVPTVSQPGRVDTAAFRQLDSILRKNYPFVDSILEKETVAGFSKILKWQGQNARLAPILLLAHLDVVPVEGGQQRWTVPPFEGKISDEYLWGRGTIDDKGSACGILEAIEMLLQTEYVPERSVFIALGHDEEVGGEGAKQMAALFKERKLEFDFVLDEGAVVLENAMPGLAAPLAMIGVGEKGYATFELSVSLPEGGHSSMPPPGTAINILSEAIVTLRDNPPPAKIEGPVLAMFEHIGPEMDVLQKTVFANIRWTQPLVKWQMSQGAASNAMLRTTIAPTLITGGFKENVLPTQANAKVNCRILPGESVESVLRYMRQTIDDERVTVSVGKSVPANEPPAVSGMNTFGYSVIQTTIRQIFPKAVVAPSLVLAATDSRHYQEVSKNIYRFLPVQLTQADLKRFHGVDERISVEQYRQSVRFYRQLILNACK